MSNQNSAVSTTTRKPDIRTLLASEDMRAKVAEVIPKYLTAESITRVMLATISRTPNLAQCTPASLMNALMLCAQAGLPPDGRHAHLIPYKDQVQVIFDWKGLVMMAERNGVENIRAATVHDHDQFSFEIVDGVPSLNHKIDWRKARGDMFAVYGTCLRDGKLDVEVMQKEEVDAIRKRSRAGSSGPWVTDYLEMAKKTVLRRMSKRWPLSPELAEALSGDADRLEDLKPAGPTRKEAQFAGEMLGAGTETQETQTQPTEPPDDIPMEHDSDKDREAAAAAERNRERKRGTQQQEKAPEAQATPWEGLKNLINGSRIDEAKFLEFCKAQGFGVFKTIDDIPLSRVKVIVADWADVLEGINAM